MDHYTEGAGGLYEGGVGEPPLAPTPISRGGGRTCVPGLGQGSRSAAGPRLAPWDSCV